MAKTDGKQRKLPEPIHSLWEALNSLPLAIVVMLLLAILSALGTVIPQEHLARPEPGDTLEMMYFKHFGAEEYIEVPLGKVTLNIPRSKHALIDSLGLKHIYFTPYFFVLLVWLSVSAIVCNITRFKRTVRQWQKPTVVRGPGFFDADERVVKAADLGTGAAATIAADFRAQGYRVFTEESDGAASIYADKGFLKRWSLVLLHFSILVLIFGGCYGKIYGVESYIRMADGEQKPLTLDLHEGKLPLVHPLIDRVPELTFDLKQDHFRIDYDRKIKLPTFYEEMHAAGKLNDDELEYERYFVKDFVSRLTIERNGRSREQEVKVNHPIKLDKLVMYQSGYQQVGFLSVSYGGKHDEIMIPPRRWVALGPQGLVDAQQAMGLGGESPYSSHGFYLKQVKAGDLYVGGEKQDFLGPLSIVETVNLATSEFSEPMLITPDQGFETTMGGETVTVRMSTRVDNYSDFSYKRDPGIPILYLGWIAMIVGITLAMYIPFSQAWVRLADDGARILITGRGTDEVRQRASQWNDMLNKS